MMKVNLEELRAQLFDLPLSQGGHCTLLDPVDFRGLAVDFRG